MPHFLDEKVNNLKLDDSRRHHIRVKNRRKKYLDMHPEYFQESSLELAGRVLSRHSSLFLANSYLDPLLYDRLVRQFQSASEREKEGREKGASGMLEANIVRSEAKIEALQHPDPNSPLVYSRAADGSINAVEQDAGERAQSRVDGRQKWIDVMGLRFINGRDGDFDYAIVDENDEYDDRAEEDRQQLEEFLGEEEEKFVGEGKPTGQTGILDY